MLAAEVSGETFGADSFYTQIHVRQEGESRKINARIPDSTAGGVDGAWVVVGVCVCVEGDCPTQERQMVAEVEVALAVAWIITISVA